MSLPGGVPVHRHPPRFGGTLLRLGAALLVAGAVVIAVGTMEAVGQAGAIADDAVARGEVSGATPQPVPFESADPELTVYLDFRGTNSFFTDSNAQDAAAAGTVCEVMGRDGFATTLRGDRQGTAATVGRFVSVGSVTLPAPDGHIACQWSRLSVRMPERLPFVVSPHTAGEVTVAVGIIFGGVALGGLGLTGVIVGLRRRRTARRLAGLPGGV